MLRQNRNLLLLFIFLCAVSIALSYRSYVNNRGIDPDLFKIAEDVRIDRFVLRKGEDSVVVQAGAGGWRVNDRYAADLQRVRLSFAAMDRARPRRFTSGSFKDSLTALLKQDGFTARFYGQDQMIFSVLAIGNDQKEITWFAKPENMQPVEMTIPGYRSNLISVFSVRENDWRDKRVFSFNWRNFTGLKATFSKTLNQDFSISVANGLLSIPGLEMPDTLRLKNYIDAIQLLEAEAILESSDELDSFLRQKPEVVLTLSEVSGRAHELRLFDNGNAVVDTVNLMRFGTSGQRILRTSRRMFVPAGSKGVREMR